MVDGTNDPWTGLILNIRLVARKPERILTPMRYFTHYFARPETLERACRWLTQIGFDESVIEAHFEGIPRLSIRVHGRELARVAQIVRAAESSDPDGWPGYWELLRMKSSVTRATPTRTSEPLFYWGNDSVPVEWHPPDARDMARPLEQIHEAYVGRGA
jgi:hypothetical protein